MLPLLLAIVANATAARSDDALPAPAPEDAPTRAPAGPWLALSPDGGSLRPAEDPALPDVAAAVDVAAPSAGELLVVRAPGLRPGPVDVVFTGEHPLAPGDAIWLSHAGLTWTLAVEEDAPWAVTWGDHPHRVQILAPSRPEPAAEPVLYWAGDLDRDGILDLVVDLGGEPARPMPTLFLSSLAEGEEHAGRAGRFVIDRPTVGSR